MIHKEVFLGRNRLIFLNLFQTGRLPGKVHSFARSVHSSSTSGTQRLRTVLRSRDTPAPVIHRRELLKILRGWGRRRGRWRSRRRRWRRRIGNMVG